MPYSFYLKSKDVKSVYPTAYRSPVFDQQADNTTEYNITNAIYRAGQRNYIISYNEQATGSAICLKVCIKGYIFEITKDALTEIIAEAQSHPADPDGSTVVLYVRTGTADSNFENTQLLEANGSALTVNCLDSNESSASTSEFMGLGVRFEAGYIGDPNANSNDLSIGRIVSGTFTIDTLSFAVIDTSKIIDLTTANTSNTLDKILHAIPITYLVLKSLRDNSNLSIGTYYRITDYTCTTRTTNTSSAGHVFDIIVLALESNKLSEEAFAAHHAGDTYFTNNKLEAWRIWYCLDNDTNRFDWAKTSGGKGVIYRMIDEFNNDVPYDFKNMLFSDSASTPKYTNAYTFSFRHDSTIKDASTLSVTGTHRCCNNIIKPYIKVDTGDNGKHHLNFNVFCPGSDDESNQLICVNNSLDLCCYNNTFGNSCSYNTLGALCNSNTFADGCGANTFGRACYSNTVAAECYSNVFGDNCHSNTLGYFNYENIFGNNCYNNTFGTYCWNNIFGNQFYANEIAGNAESNVFGSNCNHNTFETTSGSSNKTMNNVFGNNCDHNTFGYKCQENIFGNAFSYNTFAHNNVQCKFGNDCRSNTFGNTNWCITFGNGCRSNKIGVNFSDITFNDYCSGILFTYIADNVENNVIRCQHVIIDSGCTYLRIYSTNESVASQGYMLQNIHVHTGVQGTSSNYPRVITVDRELPYETDVYMSPDGYTLNYYINNQGIINIGWAQLVELRDGGKLIPGQKYRIKDYVCTAFVDSVETTDYAFDIIVTALEPNKLSEEASAAHHAGDTHFTNNKLEAWKIWYCLDNDTNRFYWAKAGLVEELFVANDWYFRDAANDNLSETYPYTFTNQGGLHVISSTLTLHVNDTVRRYQQTPNIATINEIHYNNMSFFLGRGVIYRMIDEFGNDCPYDFKNIKFKRDDKYFYTFSYTADDEERSIRDASIVTPNPTNTGSTGAVLGAVNFHCRNNVIKPYILNLSTSVQMLNSNVFYSNYVVAGGLSGHGGYFVCENNTLEADCHHNFFDGYFCLNNTFGKKCSYNALGEHSEYNTFVSDCSYIVFGLDASNLQGKFNHIVIDPGCKYLHLYSSGESEAIKNIHIHSGIAGTSSSYKTIPITTSTISTDFWPSGHSNQDI